MVEPSKKKKGSQPCGAFCTTSPVCQAAVLVQRWKRWFRSGVCRAICCKCFGRVLQIYPDWGVHTVVLDTFSIAIICCYVAFCYNDGSLTSCAVSIFDFTPSFNNIIIGLFDTDLTSICCTSCQYNELIEFIVSL